jgi:outer membrane immunogenic protein
MTRFGSPSRYNQKLYACCARLNACASTPEDVEVVIRMKKMMWMCALMAGALTAHAQESRQDVSLSALGNIPPQVNGEGAQLNADMALGALASYRFMLTPRSALEANYTFSQYQSHLIDTGAKHYEVHTRQQEVSFGYVYTRNYHNYNPYGEVGVGAMLFGPIRDFQTQSLDAKRQIALGGFFGAGVAYEISPSYDIRLGYRGFLAKAPSFKLDNDNFKTGRYEVISMPTLGIAYHF